ncbi:MAG: protoheme IX farnesyltransferase [Thermodesulfovibrio sp.]|nr:protoheme IX farnesyltransferase [Thermodesulfovibrio sp.]
MNMASLGSYANLGRLRISFATGLSAMTGYVLTAYALRPGIFLIGLGVFLLSCGASALNQYQERNIDGLMDRTKSRPLPSAALTVRDALLFAGGTAVAGLTLISVSGGMPGILLGLFAIAWYNGFYTHLKRITAFAAVPGALVGAIPPAMGWLAAGGSLKDPGLSVLGLFFFIWQVPHFWLSAAAHAEELSGADLPAVTSVFSERQLSRILFIWILATAIAALLFVPFGLTLHRTSSYLLAAVSLGLTFAAAHILKTTKEARVYTHTFTGINIYMFAVIALLFADRVV